jgi:hypothetical protein
MRPILLLGSDCFVAAPVARRYWSGSDCPPLTRVRAVRGGGQRAPRRAAREPTDAALAVPLRGRHSARAGGQFAAARLVQRKVAKGGDPLILAEGARLAPGEREKVRGPGHDPLGERPHQPAGGDFGIDHRRAAEGNAEPVDRRRQRHAELAEVQAPVDRCPVEAEPGEPRGPAELGVFGLGCLALDQRVVQKVGRLRQRRSSDEQLWRTDRKDDLAQKRHLGRV